jgi:hypothetical protein
MQGAAVVVPALTAALATGTPLLLALTARASVDRLAPDAVPAPLRAIDVGSGCAADYDGWLVEVAG